MVKTRVATSKHRIISIVEYAPNCFELDIQRKDLDYEPGTCVSIFGKTYSLCSSPLKNEHSLKLLIRKFPNGKISEKICSLQYGQYIDIEEVTNFFKPGQAEKYCYIATGVGISPFFSALKTYKHKPLMMLYGAKTKQELYERNWLKSHVNIKFTVSQDKSKHVGIHDGRVTDLLDELPIGPDITYYLCGIEGMITDVSKFLMDKGIPFDHIKQELFYSSLKA